MCMGAFIELSVQSSSRSRRVIGVPWSSTSYPGSLGFSTTWHHATLCGATLRGGWPRSPRAHSLPIWGKAPVVGSGGGRSCCRAGRAVGGGTFLWERLAKRAAMLGGRAEKGGKTEEYGVVVGIHLSLETGKYSTPWDRHRGLRFWGGEFFGESSVFGRVQKVRRFRGFTE